MLSQKEKTSATKLLSIIRDAGYSVEFEKGVEKTIQIYSNLFNTETKMLENKKCLVTGGKGFIGSHLTQKLVEYDNNVTIVDIEDEGIDSYFTIQELHNNKKESYKKIDIRDENEITKLICANNFDFIFHLAAQPITPVSNEYPEITCDINVRGTQILCNALAKSDKLARLIFASSACFYGASQSSPLVEEDLPQNKGASTYSISKQKAEKIIKDNSETGKLRSTICRMVNVYGPGDRHETRIFPKMIRCILDDQPLELTRSNGESILSFMYVEDAVSALVKCALYTQDHESYGEVFNFGLLDNNPRSINQLIHTVYNLQSDIENVAPILPSEYKDPIVKKFLNPTKAIQTLGWLAKFNLELGVAKTFKWERLYRDKLSPTLFEQATIYQMTEKEEALV